MSDADRKKIIDRADRLLKQSKQLRQAAGKILQHSDDLKKESKDIRKSVKKLKPKERL
jgi:uncharacterized protein (DUF3084 family)